MRRGVRDRQSRRRFLEVLHDLQIRKIGTLYIDRGLAVNEHAAVAIDHERGDVAFSFFANALRDAAQTHESLDGADDLIAFDDGNREHDRRLIE